MPAIWVLTEVLRWVVDGLTVEPGRRVRSESLRRDLWVRSLSGTRRYRSKAKAVGVGGHGRTLSLLLLLLLLLCSLLPPRVSPGKFERNGLRAEASGSLSPKPPIPGRGGRRATGRRDGSKGDKPTQISPQRREDSRLLRRAEGHGGWSPSVPFSRSRKLEMHRPEEEEGRGRITPSPHFM
ncbi:hypothetical protein LY78DRAFT_497659 [Colletotrichum sublineola]|nr:hypothetical protein LY78DRAFT_497659 [Colletotrichum sublineola]